MQFLLHMQEFFTLSLHHLGNRNTGRTGNHFGNFFRTHLSAKQFRPVFGTTLPGHFALALLAIELRLQLGFQLRKTAILQFRNFLPVPFARSRFYFQLDLLHLLFDVLGALHLRFFSLPNLFKISVLTPQLRYFILQQIQALL